MIQLDNVAKTYLAGETEVHALRGVTSEIKRGEFTFIVGPSGSGKSTLLYLIGALEEPSSGTISVQGRQIAAFSVKERDAYRRDEVGFVFQNFNLLGNLNALDNVLVPYLPTGINDALRQRADELLEQVGLGHRLDHRPNQLSGGEQQRVAIARALLKRPQLILADEPTGELDSENGAEVFGYLRQLRDEFESTVIVVTHDQRYITSDDRVLTLADGLLVDTPNADEVKAN